MTWYFLIALLLLQSGQTATARVQTFASFDACEASGLSLAAAIRDDTTIKQAVWQCLGVDFDVEDPLPREPRAAPTLRGRQA